MARLHNMPCIEYILNCHILISEKEIVSVTRQVENNKFHVQNIMESCLQLAAILTIALWWLLDLKEL